MTAGARRERLALLAVAALAAFLFGWFTTAQHIKVRGIDYLEEGNQVKRHRAVLAGESGDPWQYRVLPNYIIKGMVWVCRKLDAPRPHVAVAFFVLRRIVDTTVFAMAFVYYRKLGLSGPSSILGMCLLAWGMSYSHYDSDLQFSTYMDVVFYLIAGTCIVRDRLVWLIPISALAALNRETSALIPVMLLFARPRGSGGSRTSLIVVAACLVIYWSTFVGLRTVYGVKPFVSPYGHQPGLDILMYNVGRLLTWQELFAVVGVVPFAALVGYRRWPAVLRAYLWAVFPLWILAHSLYAVMAEARQMLVPQALIFIPGALFFAEHTARDPGTALSPS